MIEILVVLVVIAVLASLVAPNVFRHVGTAKETAARSQIEMLAAALDAYRLDVGRYPTSSESLDALIKPPTGSSSSPQWRGPYLRKAVPADPWNHAYIYRSPGVVNPTAFDLLSLGADGTEGGVAEAADVVSWK